MDSIKELDGRKLHGELILLGVVGFFVIVVVVTWISLKYFTRPTVLFNPLAIMTEVGLLNSFQASSSHPSCEIYVGFEVFCRSL